MSAPLADVKNIPSNTRKSSQNGASKPKAAPKPSMVEMIKNCILHHSWEAHGVSRPVIKKYIQATYGIPIDNNIAKDIGKALKDGVDDEVFVMPNGLNGKVKLAMPKPNPPAAPQPKEPTSDDKAVPKIKISSRKVEVVIPPYKSKGLVVNNLYATPRKGGPLEVHKENVDSPRLVLKKGPVHKLARHSPLKPLSPNIVKALPKIDKLDPKKAAGLPAQPAKPLLTVQKHANVGKSPARLNAKKPPMKRVTKAQKEQTVSIIRRRGSPKVSPPVLAPGTVIGGAKNAKWRLQRKLGAGGFGDVWMAVGDDDSNKGEQVAVKVEYLKCDLPLLDMEAKVFDEMAASPDYPKKKFMFDYGVYRYLGMEMLGQSAESLRWKYDRVTGTLPVPKVLEFGICALRRLEELHNKGWVHRDIKPDNFITGGATRSSEWFLIDFGFCKRYIDPNTSKHIPQRYGKGCLGTPRYCGLNVHRGYEPSRRDDLEALAYCMVYLAKGRLPWQGINKDLDIWEETKIIKSTTPLAELCQWLPPVFSKFVMYCQCLDYEEKPNYKSWREDFRKAHADQFRGTQYSWAMAPPPIATLPKVTYGHNTGCRCNNCKPVLVVA